MVRFLGEAIAASDIAIILPCDTETADAGLNGAQQPRADGQSNEYRSRVFILGRDEPRDERMSPTTVSSFMRTEGAVPLVLDSPHIKIWVNPEAEGIQITENILGKSTVSWHAKNFKYEIEVEGYFVPSSEKRTTYTAPAHRPYDMNNPPFEFRCTPLKLTTMHARHRKASNPHTLTAT